MALRRHTGFNTTRVFQTFEKEGKLPIRVSCFLKMEPGLANPKKYEPLMRSEHLRFAGLKQITDGVCGYAYRIPHRAR